MAPLATKYRCLGVDTSEQAIVIARKKHPHVEFVCGGIPGAIEPVRPTRALYLLLDVLEHVADDAWFLSDLFATIRPGSQVLITVPARMSLWSKHDATSGHYRRYELGKFRSLVNRFAVDTRLLSYFNARLYPAIYLARFATRGLGTTVGYGGSDFFLPPSWLNRALAAAFAGESRRLERLIDAPGARSYPIGVSLITLLRSNSEQRGS